MEMTEELVKQIALDAVNTYVKESGMDKTDQKYLVIPDADEKETLKKKKDERFGQLAKAIYNRDIVQIKAVVPNNVTIDADGGYLVPDETKAEILELVKTFGQARKYVDVGQFPTNRDILKLPVDASNLSVYYPGENATITSSKGALSVIQMTAKKAAGLVTITDELKDMAIVDFAAYLKNKMAQAFAIDEDSKVFGTTNTVFTGLFYSGNTYGYTGSETAVANITYDDLLSVVYGIDPNYTVGAKWFMHRTMIAYLRGLKDSNGMPLLTPANANGLPELLGYEVVSVENGAPAAATAGISTLILFGNLKNSFLKEKSTLAIDTSNAAYVDGTSYFQNDLTGIRFIRHWAFDPGLTSAYGAIVKTI